jgi:DNA-binding MarR family transcriptional regulator
MMNATKVHYDPKGNPMTIKRRPFTMVDNKVVDDESIGMREKCVYLAISRHASNDNGTCYPSRIRLAKRAGCSIRTVDRALGELEKRGYIKIQPGYEGRANNYSLSDVYKYDDE